MGTLYITEYQTAASDQGRALPLGHGKPIANQVVSNGGASAQASPFSKFTHFIRVHNDGVNPCSILVGLSSDNGGAGPNATTTCGRMAQNQTEYFGVDPGMILAVCANS